MRIGDIRVDDPCCESWADMPGDAIRRHCEECESDVVNLSELTRNEAAALVTETGFLCVRFRRDSTGNVVFRDLQLGRQRRGVRELVGAAAFVAPFLFWATVVSPVGECVSWSTGAADVLEETQVVVQGGISFVPPSDSDGYSYSELDGTPQAVVFVDENGTPRLDKHKLPDGQKVSDGTPRWIVPADE